MYVFFFFNDPATTEIYTLSLHDALPIYLISSRNVGSQNRLVQRHPILSSEECRISEQVCTKTSYLISSRNVGSQNRLVQVHTTKQLPFFSVLFPFTLTLKEAWNCDDSSLMCFFLRDRNTWKLDTNSISSKCASS